MAIGHGRRRVRSPNHGWLDRVLRWPGNHCSGGSRRIHRLLRKVRASHRRVWLHRNRYRPAVSIRRRNNTVGHGRRYTSGWEASLYRWGEVRVVTRVSHRRCGGRQASRHGGGDCWHWGAAGRSLERGWWDRVVGRVGRRVHRIVRSGILSWRWKRALEVGSLRMRKHTGRSVAACWIIPAWNHTSNFWWRKIRHSRVISHVGRRRRRRRVVGDTTVRHHGWWHGIVIRAWRRVITFGRIMRRIVRVVLLHRNVLGRYFVSRRGEKFQDDWV